MSDRVARVSYVLASVAVLLTVALRADAELRPSLSEGLWAEFLVAIILAAFVVEPHYSGTAAATTNAIAVAAFSLGADPKSLQGWWDGLRVASAGTVLLSLVVYLLRDPDAESSATRARRARLIGRVVSLVGAWRSILVAALLLSLATFNTPLGPEWSSAAIVVVFVAGVANLQPHRLYATWSGALPETEIGVSVAALAPPCEVVLTEDRAGVLSRGMVVGLESDRGTSAALVVDEATLGGRHAWRALAPGLVSAVPDSPQEEDPAPRLRVTKDADPGAELLPIVEELAQPDAWAAGILAEGSEIESAAIELLNHTTVHLGNVLWTRTGDKRVLWQVTNGVLTHSRWAGDSRRTTTATASQIGTWDADALMFESFLATPTSAQLVFGGQLAPPPLGAFANDLFRIGGLPESPFPVFIDLAQLSRSHGAILGTTGTGKTHLAFAIVEALRERGVKVLCLDQTGQYLTRFPDATQPTAVQDLQTFLQSPDLLAVMRPSGMSPITFVNQVVTAAHQWASSQGTLNMPQPARCVVVMEEAQNFIPEAFVVNDWDLKATAQDTSLRIMEGRKFGLGFLLVSQRTAMITKSALSQCNTVFAFQASDQTGLDYLAGLCGRTTADSIPLLPHRTTIAMGLAVRSRAPLITYIDTAGVVIG